MKDNIFRGLLKPFYSRERWEQKERIREWSDHADPRKLDWVWTETNYNRIAVVNLLVAKFADPSYLEIGCATNILFDSVPVLRKIGVDPAAGGTHRMTSDEFFRQNSEKFDVVFIDGLHTYQQARNDVVNAIRCLNDGGWIAMHDLLPRSWREHHVPRLQQEWTGDVWKVAFELMRTPGVDFRLLKIDRGVGVFKLTRGDVALVDATAELADKQFAYYLDHLSELPVTEWRDAQPWLRVIGH